jgi:alanyl-tRNA synthetase
MTAPHSRKGLQMTKLMYREHPDRLDFEARIVERRDHQGAPAVILDQTAFYPEGGGQPSDVGHLDGVAVTAVLEVGGEILHLLAGPIGHEGVRGSVDAARRRDHTQQHHGQHLLSRAFVETAGASTIAFHLGAETTTIDLQRETSAAQVDEAERLANDVVWQARPVSVKLMPRAEAEAAGLSPSEHAGETIRVIEVAGFDIQPCSGTHPQSTSEVGVILVVGHERYKGGSRIELVCGERAVRAFHQHAKVAARLGTLLSSPLSGLTEAAEAVVARVQGLERRCRSLLDDALETEARRLLAGAGAAPVVTATFEERPPDELRTLAQKLTSLAPCVALLASRDSKAHLVFARSEGIGVDVPALLKQAVARLGGRGGGRDNLAQGGGSPENLDSALAEAAAAARREIGRET